MEPRDLQLFHVSLWYQRKEYRIFSHVSTLLRMGDTNEKSIQISFDLWWGYHEKLINTWKYFKWKMYLKHLVYLVEKEMAPHSSTLAWKIPWMEEPGRLQSMGSLRVGHDWATSLSLFTFTHWKRKWQPTPVFLPGESQGSGSLVGCHLWGRTESDMTEVT